MQDDFRPIKGPAKPAAELKPTPIQKKSTEPTPLFQTPEQVSGHDGPQPDIDVKDTPEPSRGSGHHWFNLPWPPTKHEVITASVLLAMVGFAFTGYALLNRPTDTRMASPATAKIKQTPKVTTVPATLSGLPVDPSVNQRPVVGAMIENSLAARPQAGLSEAGVVFEAVAEGGITRLLALFQDQQPGNIGPIRSARPYYVQWNEGFKAAYAHVGGSPDALAAIKNWGVQDLNQYYNGGIYRKEASRAAPHNIYANVGELASVATQKGYSSQYSGFARKAAAVSKTPNATSIDLAVSSVQYNPHFDFDAATNSYRRSIAGVAQTDSNNSRQISPNVVIALIVPLGSGGRTAQGSSYSNYNPLGSGQALVFQDGTVTAGTWNKATNTDQLTFTDASGAPLKLNPGQTWLTALPSTGKAVYR